MYQFEKDCMDVRDDRNNLIEQRRRMEDVTADFVGQNLDEKMEEGIEYYVNPVHSSQGTDIGNISISKFLN